MLTGDFFQIPPIKGKSLFSSVLNLNLSQQNSNPEIHGSWLFSLFKHVELKQQMRAADDVEHMDMLNCMRNVDGQQSVTRRHLNQYRYLTPQDFMNDSSWASAPILVLNNKEKPF
jgi:hypothetical protein